MKKVLKGLLPYVIILVVVILLRTFVMTPVRVSGDSMLPTLNNGDIMILNKVFTPGRFNMVVIEVDGEQLVKRLIGLPGDTISMRDEYIQVNDDLVLDEFGYGHTESFGTIIVGADQYFVLGDNRTESKDSRYFGTISGSQIKGTATLRFWPFNKFGMIR